MASVRTPEDRVRTPEVYENDRGTFGIGVTDEAPDVESQSIRLSDVYDEVVGGLTVYRFRDIVEEFLHTHILRRLFLMYVCTYKHLHAYAQRYVVTHVQIHTHRHKHT